jgi:hypothetical protein
MPCTRHECVENVRIIFIYVHIFICVFVGFWQIRCLTRVSSVIASLHVIVIITFVDCFGNMYRETDNSAVRFLVSDSEKVQNIVIHTYLLTYLLTYSAGSMLRSCQFCSHSRTSQHFIQPEGSSPSSQESSTSPYPEPDRSSPYHPILSL